MVRSILQNSVFAQNKKLYLFWVNINKSDFQKQPSRDVLRKGCSEYMQQIYGRTPMPESDFNKVVAILLKLHFGMGVLLHIFRKPFPKNTSGELHLDFLWGYLKRKTALFLLTIIRCLINILRETKEGCIQNALGQILLWLILQIEISNIIFLKLIIFQLNYDLLFPFQKILNNINR